MGGLLPANSVDSPLEIVEGPVLCVLALVVEIVVGVVGVVGALVDNEVVFAVVGGGLVVGSVSVPGDAVAGQFCFADSHWAT